MSHVRLLPIALIALRLAMPGIARADSDPSSEIAVKAAFLYNFAKFTDWPSLGPAAPITLCVVGDARLAGTLLETVRSQHIGGHALDVRAMGGDAPLGSCALVFISASETRRVAAVMDNLTALPVLTVSDVKGFAQTRGIVELVAENGRMRFVVNADAADRSGLRLSSRLLGLAQMVRDKRDEP